METIEAVVTDTGSGTVRAGTESVVVSPPGDVAAARQAVLRAAEDAVRERNQLDSSLIEDVLLGCVVPVGEQDDNITHITMQVAGFDHEVPGVQLNRFCASGLEAENMAAQKVRSGWEDLVVAGGV